VIASDGKTFVLELFPEHTNDIKAADFHRDAATAKKSCELRNDTLGAAYRETVNEQ
jgi:hypothetical protein